MPYVGGFSIDIDGLDRPGGADAARLAQRAYGPWRRRLPRPRGAEGLRGAPPNPTALATYEVSRTLVKSPPELWAELTGDCLSEAVGEVSVRTTEPERELEWVADGASGTARLEPSSWGTKVTLTAEVEEQVAEHGFWARMRVPEPSPHEGIEQKLEALLDELGSAHRKPFVRE